MKVNSLRIEEVHVKGIDTPVRQLGARLDLGADGGALHKLDSLHLNWDRLRLDGHAQVATTEGLAVDAALDLTQQPAGTSEWAAALRLAGPLATPQLQATLRAQATPSQPPQTLDASATLHPFAAWPLGDLQATARALDLVGAARRRTAHGAGPGRVGAHAGTGPAGAVAAVAEQP